MLLLVNKLKNKQTNGAIIPQFVRSMKSQLQTEDPYWRSERYDAHDVNIDQYDVTQWSPISPCVT